ncbi:MAG TPA: sugar ABC transporter permease [Mycobacteriales bacterium]|nr:sugar ABC transporter permease [Mycobacteriales bacterium]
MSHVADAEAPSQGARHRNTRAELSEGARSERRLGWALCAPAVVVMLLVTAYPIIYAIYLSFRRDDLRFPAQSKFIGFDNYVTVLSSNIWWHSLWVTLGITVISVIIEFLFGLVLALVMHRTIWGRGAVRTAVLIPYGIVTIAAGLGWQYAWTPGIGWIQQLSGGAPLTHSYQALGAVILAEVWKTTPFMALLLMAGLALVPEELVNAAKMDGATAWERFSNVMLPVMKPAILVALLFRTLDAFRIFDNIYALTGGANGTGSVSFIGYDNLFVALNLGVGSAISVLIFICVAIIAFIFIKAFGTATPGSDLGGRG